MAASTFQARGSVAAFFVASPVVVAGGVPASLAFVAGGAALSVASACHLPSGSQHSRLLLPAAARDFAVPVAAVRIAFPVPASISCPSRGYRCWGPVVFQQGANLARVQKNWLAMHSPFRRPANDCRDGFRRR